LTSFYYLSLYLHYLPSSSLRHFSFSCYSSSFPFYCVSSSWSSCLSFCNERPNDVLPSVHDDREYVRADDARVHYDGYDGDDAVQEYDDDVLNDERLCGYDDSFHEPRHDGDADDEHADDDDDLYVVSDRKASDGDDRDGDDEAYAEAYSLIAD